MDVVAAADLVIFDYDGVLCRAEVFTPEAIRLGLRRFGELVGLAIPEPDEANLLATLGYPSMQTYPPMLPEAVRDRWEEMHTFTLDAMCERITALGHEVLYPGAAGMLTELVSAGKVLGLASNSSARYQATHRDAVGLDQWFRHCYHAQSPMVTCKADMVRLICESEPGRQAVMIGDRLSDRLAAERNGIPFVACSYGFGHAAEWDGAVAIVDSIASLRELLLQPVV